MTTETRLDQVERELRQVSARLCRLESGVEEEGLPVRPAPSPSPSYVPPAFRGRPDSELPRPRPVSVPRVDTRVDFEELFGGRVLAWIGSLAILIGAVLFMAMAVGNGWLGETARTVIAAFGSFSLLLAGVWLHERQGRTEAAQAAVASGISGLYATLVVATQAYELIPAGSGLIFAALIAGVGFAIAVRWSSPIVAAVGSLGALSAPLLVDVGTSGTGIFFVALALAATVAILIWQRWDWLALGAFVISVPQVLVWIVDLLNVNNEGTLTVALMALVGFWALYVTAALGYELRSRAKDMLPVASALLLFGSGVFVVGGGYLAFDVAHEQSAAALWVFGFSALYLLLGGGALRLVIHREVGSLLIGFGLALSGLGFAEAFDGPGLVLAWTAESAALAFLASRFDTSVSSERSSAERLLFTAGAFLALAIGHVLTFEAPPAAMIDGVEDLGDALVAIVGCAAAALACYEFGRRIHPGGATTAAFAGAASLVYLGSVLIVDTIGVTGAGESRQAGQVWLSAFWTATGLGAVVWGLVRRSADVRLGGLALLGIAIAKVWTYDLSELEEMARVLSFIGLGLLLLVGAFAYQRIKPAETEEREPQASL